jgi:predicted kinase
MNLDYAPTMNSSSPKKPLVIVISGLPCTGKTTLGKRIARECSVPFFSKDGFKERLFDELGWSDRAWSKKLGLASYKLLFYALEAQLEVGQSCVVEANFYPEFHSQILNDFKQHYQAEFFQIHCHAQPQILLERFRARWESGTRHPGHADNVTLPEMEQLVYQKPFRLELAGITWDLDGTNLKTLETDALFAALQAQL